MMAFVFFLIAILAIVAAGAIAFYAFHVRTQLGVYKERSQLLEHSHEQAKQQLSKSAQILENCKSQFKQQASNHKHKILEWDATRAKLLDEIRGLSKYRDVEDAIGKAAKLKAAAKENLQKANKLAEDTLSKAKKDARAELAEARREAKSIKDDVASTLNTATLESSKIVADARKKAKEIAGGVYEVMEKSELFEKTAKAMRNLIKGYGDEYIIPEASLLDDLSDDFSFDAAGRSLKLARERTKQMMKNGTAAACDYAESSRRGNAINFVLDAFNGKVDSILSRTKHDNAGKLAQSIRDAFSLVNFNGRAFKNARISDLFLDSRLEELKWAEICQQLALKDREEQRDAKEKIREEARALKEQEKALKEAAKEEEMLQKALLQAREEFQHSSGKQREMYEERLKDMEARLGEAMERKERARSMAEKTRKGYVYIISNIGSFGEDVFKIGLTRRDNPLDRVRELGDASVPFGFDVHAMILADDAPALEHQLHKHFAFKQINKVNHRKEFFRVSLSEIKSQIETMNLTTGVKWTLTSEAREYKESLAIENSPNELKAWKQRQRV